jgi:hypothetical protein
MPILDSTRPPPLAATVKCREETEAIFVVRDANE